MEDEINLLDYWKIIVKRRQIIIWLTILLAAISFGHAITQPSMYKATASIMLVDSGSGGLTAALASVPFLGGANSGGGEVKLSSILGSHALARQVVASIDIKKYFPATVHLGDELRNKIAAESLQGVISPSSADGLYTVSAVWTQPDQAAELANLYVEELGKFLNKRALNINFQVIDPAVTPKARFSPKIRQEIMLGGILGIFIGIFLAFALEFIATRNRQN